MAKNKNKTAKITKPKTDTAPKARPKKHEQLEVPGTERKRVPQVEEAANTLREIRGERMELQKTEAEAAQALIDVMREHGVKVYKFDAGDEELVAEMDDKTKVSVRKAKTARSEDE